MSCGGGCPRGSGGSRTMGVIVGFENCFAKNLRSYGLNVFKFK
jgi:hypothetical protein